MDELPTDWRERMVALVSGQVPADGALFAGGPALSPLEQIGVYRRQYVLRLTEAVEDDLLGLAALVGEERLHAWVLAYLAAHPSESWTLNRLSVAFPDWLAHQDVTVVEHDMALLDRAVQSGFEAASGHVLTPEDLAAMPALSLAPHVTLLELSTNVHAVRTALLAGDVPPEVVEAPVKLAVYRRGRSMRHWVMPDALFVLCQQLAAGRPLMAALEGLLVDGHLTPEDLQASVGGWFRELAEEGVVVRS